MRGLAYEDAAELLERALEGDLDERDPRRAEVLLALGDARPRSGDAPPAGERFREAAGAARALGDGELLARAALGAAGLAVSVGPVRDGGPGAARGGAGRRGRGLAAAAAAARAAGDRALLRAAGRGARAPQRRGPGRRARAPAGAALLEALGARHVALWSPAHTEERLAIADELVAAARAAGDREAELQGVNWRVADLFELGDRDALTAAIAEHERLAGELRLPSFAWYGPLWRADAGAARGRLDEARRLSEEGARIGRLAHDENAALLFGVQRRSIRMSGGGLPEEDARRDRPEHRALPRPVGVAGGAARCGPPRPATSRWRGASSRAGWRSWRRRPSTPTGSTPRTAWARWPPGSATRPRRPQVYPRLLPVRRPRW